MMLVIKLLVAAVCLLIAAFCVFGLLATFEPGVRHALVFRVIYGSVGIACLGGVVFLAVDELRTR